MFKSHTLPITLLCLFLLVLLQPLAPMSPAPVYAADERKDTQAAPVVVTRKEPCSAEKFDALRAELDQARGGWIQALAPTEYEKFNKARKVYMKYATRCAKKLDLNLKDALSGVVQYDAPTKSSSSAPKPRAPEAATANGILFDGSPGTAAPPSSLGVYSMTVFPADPRAVNTGVLGVNSPLGGAVQFSTSLIHLLAGGTYVWGHGYTGDVYDNLGTSVTLSMPPNTRAFYFYAQPFDGVAHDITATANDGTSSYPVSTINPNGAKYFGFYAPVSGADLSSITVSCPSCGGGFGIGEFGIYQNSGADLRLVKYSEPHNVVQAGEIFTYTIFVDNLGPDIANHVVISDTLLSSGAVSVQSCAFSVSQGGGLITQFTCTTGDLVSTQFGSDIGTFSTDFLEPLSPSSQGRLRASFRLVANGAVDVTNTTRVSSDTYDPNLNNNFAEDTLTVTPAADLTLTKTAPTDAGAGEEISYTLVISNTGPSIATNVQVSDYLHAQFKLLTLTPSQGSCEAGVEGDPLRPFVCNLGNLQPATGASIAVFGQVRSDTLGDTLLFNDAQVTSDVADTNLANNVDTVTTAIVATCGVLPNQPLTLSPPDGKNLKKPTVLLDWTDVNCAVNYKVVVRQNSTAKPNFLSAKNLPVSQYTTEPLPVDHDYYWRGIACNGGGCKRSDWSMFRVNQ